MLVSKQIIQRSLRCTTSRFPSSRVLSSASVFSQQASHENSSSYGKATAAVAAVMAIGGVTMAANVQSNKAKCDFAVQPSIGGFLPGVAVQEEKEEAVDGALPVITSAQVAKNNGKNGSPMWMSYGGMVYDVTNFVHNHPGGSEKIMSAAGGAIEPFWHIYRQHLATDQASKIMERLVVGQLAEEDQEKIDEQMELLQETTADPYALEPVRHSALMIHGEQPMNAEVPEKMLTNSYVTDPNLFFIRHHHPVPHLTPDQALNYQVEIDLSQYGLGQTKISLQDLQKMPKTEVTTTLQCSGNRRSGFNEFGKTSGTAWIQGAISTATWGGVRLRDLIKHAGLQDEIEAAEKGEMRHIRFHSLDGMMASIGIEKAMNPYGDVILCYEMNGKPLPRDHGYPLRIIVPGYAAVRNVKWINKIELSAEEAEGPWQRGLNYKILPPNVTDAKDVDLNTTPSINELSVYSGITNLEPAGKSKFTPGETILIKATGWAYAGGGRNIVRVDLTGDKEGDCKWTTAALVQGADQPYGRAWAWTFWEATVPAKVKADGSVDVHSKAIDSSMNSQPESCEHTWNVRGLMNNSWFKKNLGESK